MKEDNSDNKFQVLWGSTKLHHRYLIGSWIQYLGLPSKAVTASNICLKDKNKIVFNATKNCSIFKNYFSILAHNLVSKLPLSSNIFTESKIASYCDNNAVPEDLTFQLSETSSEKILKSILKGLNPSKAAGIDNLSGKIFKRRRSCFSTTNISTLQSFY